MLGLQFIRKMLGGVEVKALHTLKLGKIHFYGSGLVHGSIVILKQESFFSKLLPQSWEYTIVWINVCWFELSSSNVAPVCATTCETGASFTKFATCKLRFATQDHFSFCSFWHISLIKNKLHTCDPCKSIRESCRTHKFIFSLWATNHLWNVTLPPFTICVYETLANHFWWNRPLIKIFFIMIKY